MAQALGAYLVTAAAALWVVWSVLAPKSVRRRLMARLTRRPAPVGRDGGGCDCGGTCRD